LTFAVEPTLRALGMMGGWRSRGDVLGLAQRSKVVNDGTAAGVMSIRRLRGDARLSFEFVVRSTPVSYCSGHSLGS
jgi:hypothetical protein